VLPDAVPDHVTVVKALSVFPEMLSAALAVKVTPVMSDATIVSLREAGENTNPLRLGVIVYVPLDKPVMLKFPLPSAVTLPLA
jgi:hypothetical protein